MVLMMCVVGFLFAFTLPQAYREIEGGGFATIIGKFLATPTTERELFQPIKNSPAWQHKENGSIWEKDITNHGSEQLNLWSNRKA